MSIEASVKMLSPAEVSHSKVVDNSQANETSEEESISSDQEVVLNPQPSVYALYRGTTNGLDIQ